MSRPARYLLFAQIGFSVSLVVCALLDPEGLRDNHGWSYYEEHEHTLVPYLLGFAGLVILIVYAARLLERTAAPPGLAAALRWLAVFLLLDVATPDTVNSLFYWAHDLTSALLFVYELGFAFWLVRTVWPTRFGIALVVTQFVGGLVAMLSQLHLISALGPGILIFQVSFGILLVAAVAHVGEVALDEVVADEEVTAPAVGR